MSEQGQATATVETPVGSQPWTPLPQSAADQGDL